MFHLNSPKFKVQSEKTVQDFKTPVSPSPPFPFLFLIYGEICCFHNGVFLQNINEICKPLLPGFCINNLEWNKKISCA